MANAINKSFKLTFMILGDSGAGKTNFLSTFMNKLFNIEKLLFCLQRDLSYRKKIIK